MATHDSTTVPNSGTTCLNHIRNLSIPALLDTAGALSGIGSVLSEDDIELEELQVTCLGQAIQVIASDLGFAAGRLEGWVVKAHAAIKTPEVTDSATRDDSAGKAAQHTSDSEQLLERLNRAIELLITDVSSACNGIKENAILVADSDLSESQLTGIGDGMTVLATSILENAGNLDALLHDVIKEVRDEH